MLGATNAWDEGARIGLLPIRSAQSEMDLAVAVAQEHRLTVHKRRAALAVLATVLEVRRRRGRGDVRVGVLEVGRRRGRGHVRVGLLEVRRRRGRGHGRVGVLVQLERRVAVHEALLFKGGQPRLVGGLEVDGLGT